MQDLGAFRIRRPPGLHFSARRAIILGGVFLALILAQAGFRLLTHQPQRTLPTGTIPLRANLSPEEKMTAYVDATDLAKAFRMYAELTGRTQLPESHSLLERIDDLAGQRLSRWHWFRRPPPPDSGIQYHRDGRFTAGEVKEQLEAVFRTAGLVPVPVGTRHFRVVNAAPLRRQSPSASPQ